MFYVYTAQIELPFIVLDMRKTINNKLVFCNVELIKGGTLYVLIRNVSRACIERVGRKKKHEKILNLKVL